MDESLRSWLSIHVFLSDPLQLERYLRERIAPTIALWSSEGRLERWFYIRYWEGGPHLRIRLCGPIRERQEEALETFSRGIASYRSPTPPTRDAYYRDQAFDGQPVAVEALPWYQEGTVACIDYEPELLRYGGDAAIVASERLFDLSSRLALKLCAATEGRRNARVSLALPLMVAAVFSCDEDMRGAGAFFEQYGRVWNAMVEPGAAAATMALATSEQQDLLGKLEHEARTGWSANSVHGVWGAGVRQLVETLRARYREGRLVSPFDGRIAADDDACRQAVLGIVGSQIHMLNNRLGIPPAGELLLARIVSGAANAMQGQGAAA